MRVRVINGNDLVEGTDAEEAAAGIRPGAVAAAAGGASHSGRLPSRLGLLDGVGTLLLERNESGELASASGAWWPNELELGCDDLRELFPAGAILVYEGSALVPGSGAERVRLEVEVRGIAKPPIASSHSDDAPCAVLLAIEPVEK